jgi:hypothetical protein
MASPRAIVPLLPSPPLLEKPPRASPPPPALTDKPPSSEEWSQWLRSLITAPQGPLLDSVIQVFSRHAGAGQVDALIALYQNEADRAARERIARVLATLASPAALEAVRMVFIHRGSGIDAPLRSACARAVGAALVDPDNATAGVGRLRITVTAVVLSLISWFGYSFNIFQLEWWLSNGKVGVPFAYLRRFRVKHLRVELNCLVQIAHI